MKYIKKCSNCDKKFYEGDDTFKLNICDVCTEKLEEYEYIEKVEVYNPTRTDDVDTTLDEYECEECGCTYPVNIKECEICGTPNPYMRTISKQKEKDIISEETILGDFIEIDSLGYIHIIDKEEDRKYENLDRLKIYINNKVYKTIPIKFNEITVGRNSLRFIPTYDLSKIDQENYISRKHLLLYRDQGNVYARNLSSKNTIHINGELLLENESKMLNHNDELTLSGYIVTKFFRGDF